MEKERVLLHIQIQLKRTNEDERLGLGIDHPNKIKMEDLEQEEETEK